MSMTREEAITQLDLLLEYCESMMTSEYPVWRRDCEALQMLIAALRPISREQVEKVWRGEWEWYDEEIGSPLDGIEREWGWRCSKCKVVLPDDFDDPDNPPAMRFCQWCGAPMTNESMEIVMKRLEALKDGSTTD